MSGCNRRSDGKRKVEFSETKIVVNDVILIGPLKNTRFGGNKTVQFGPFSTAASNAAAILLVSRDCPSPLAPKDITFSEQAAMDTEGALVRASRSKKKRIVGSGVLYYKFAQEKKQQRCVLNQSQFGKNKHGSFRCSLNYSFSIQCLSINIYSEP
jgi:hypothetical protein